MQALMAICRIRRNRLDGCLPMTPAERMAKYSPRHAAEMLERANLAAGLPHARIVDGRLVLVALPGKVNPIPAPVPAAEES